MGSLRRIHDAEEALISEEIEKNQHLVGKRVRIVLEGTITNVAVDVPGGFDIAIDDPIEDNFWWNTNYPFTVVEDTKEGN